MKKTILIILAVFNLGTLVAQNTQPPADSRTKPATVQQNNQVPNTVNQRFTTDYPNTRSTWSTYGTGYRAEYTDPNTKMGRAVVYDMDGNPTGMEKEINKGEYPASINQYYSTNFPNEQYKVWTRDEDGKRNYYITRPNEVIWFDDKGNYNRKNARSPEIK